MITLLVTRIPRYHVKYFVANLFLFVFIAFGCKKKNEQVSVESACGRDVGVAVRRREPNLNNLFRLPTAFDITLELDGM